MQISARNQLKGTVKRLNKARSTLRLQELSDGVEIVSIITKQSSEQSYQQGKSSMPLSRRAM
jgi:molybdopterin-binding protein